MSAVSPSPAPPSQTPSSNSTQPPSSSTVPPTQQPTTPPPSSTTSTPPQQPSSPTPSNSSSPPPTASPPPPTRLAPPPTVPLAPPPSQLAPPPSQSPPLSPPPVASPPISPSRPPPPPPTSPTRPSPPPQSSVPPRSSPPPSTPPSPPSLSAPPPSNPAPPPASPPTENPPPPAAVQPPRRSPPPPTRHSTTTPPPASPPTENPPPPAAVPPPPRNSTSTPPRASPPEAVSSPPPPRNSTSTPPRASPPEVVSSPPPPSPPPSSTPPSTNSPPSPTTPTSQPAPPSKSTPPPLPRPLLSPPPQNRSENSSPESGSSGGIGTGAIVGIAVCGGILLLGFIGVALWCCLNRQKRRNPPNDGYVMPFTLPSSTESDSSSLKKLSSAPLIKSDSGSDVVYTSSDTGGSGMGHSRNWFSYEELIKATDGFSTQNILGEGGFGFVYKGSLPDGREVAVKQLKLGGGQGEKEFKAEVEIISRIHHRHLVSLVGYCIQDNRRLLVYDYVPNNTLHFHLHGEGQPVLEWANRVKIAAGAARGIAYLHEDCNPRIIHRDIKPSNILLDYNYEAMVADFGLAKLVLDSYTPITTRVMGTFGYVAPEYASSGKLTEKSDVYSFGVVLLELITGRKPIDESQPSGEDCLVEWARPLLSDALETQKIESLVDPRLEKNYVESEMFCMIQVAAVCVRHSASKRPNMGQVVRAIDGLAASDIMNGMRVGESQALNSMQQAQLRWFQRAAAGSFSNNLFSQETLHTQSSSK